MSSAPVRTSVGQGPFTPMEPKQTHKHRAFYFLMARWGLPVDMDVLIDLMREFEDVEREAKE